MFLIFFLFLFKTLNFIVGSNEYQQSLFYSKNKKNRFTLAHSSFTIQKWGLRGYTCHGHVICDVEIY